MITDERLLGCDYAGYEFGGGYIDSTCIDGYLWDLDSCDEPGGGLTSGGEWACPRCNTREFLAAALEYAQRCECGTSMGTPHCGAVAWEGAVAKAKRENLAEAEAFLAAVKPFVAADWPDRQAVYDGRARWDQTVEVTWPWSLPQPPQGATP